MKRFSTLLLLASVLATCSGCEAQGSRRATYRESRASYPVEPQPAPVDLADRSENPDSQVWPLDLWLVEFEKRNGVELHYRDRDTFGRTVVRPGPGPFDSDDQAEDALRRVVRVNGMTLVREKAHVYSIKRLDGIRPAR